MNWLQRILQTKPTDASALILRLSLGSVMFAHGMQKLLGWFGGYGFSGTMDALTTDLHLPWFTALLVILVESIGGLCLMLGLATRIMAAGIGVVMLGAIMLVHWDNGFFMDWNNTLGGEGFEYHILAIGLAVALMLQGGGLLSTDNWLLERLKMRASTDKIGPEGIAIQVRREKVVVEL
jgi:putative oxidoreductase